MQRLLPSQWFAIVISFLAAFLLTILPLPTWAVWFRPAWVLMIVIFWVMIVPSRVNLGIAWVSGLILDALTGTALGMHALAFTVIAFLVLKMHQRLRFFPMWQQAGIIFLFAVLYQIILLLVQGFLGNLAYTKMIWIGCFTTMLLWPWLYIVLRDVRLSLKIQ